MVDGTAGGKTLIQSSHDPQCYIARWMTVLCDKGCQKSNRKNLFKRLSRADKQRLDNSARRTKHTAQYDKPHGGFHKEKASRSKKPGSLEYPGENPSHLSIPTQ